MTTLFLKTDTAAPMKTALASAFDGFVSTDEDGEEMLCVYNHQWAVDWDIPIVTTPAVFDEAGETVVEPAVMEAGFFCNVIVHDAEIDASSLNALDQKPATPQRVFA